MCLHANQKPYVTCNFGCYIETEGLVKVTGSHVLKTLLLQATDRK